MHTYKHSQDTDKCTGLHIDVIKQNLDIRSEDEEGEALIIPRFMDKVYCTECGRLEEAHIWLRSSAIQVQIYYFEISVQNLRELSRSQLNT